MPQPHNGEYFRGLVHAVTGSLAISMCLYNAMRFGETRTRRNAVNAVLYAGLWAYELHNTRLHWTAETPEPEMLGIGA